MMQMKEVLFLWFANFLIKNPQVGVLIMKLSKISSWLKNYINQSLKKKLKRRVYPSCKHNIWDADLVKMKLISKFNK